MWLSKVSNTCTVDVYYDTRHYENDNKMTWNNNMYIYSIYSLLMCIEYLILLIMPLPRGCRSLLMSLPFPVDLIIELLHALPAASTWKLQCLQLRDESVGKKRGMLRSKLWPSRNEEHDDKPKRIFGFSYGFMVSSRMGKRSFPPISGFQIMKS